MICTTMDIKRCVEEVIKSYPVTRVTLFGSRAEGTNNEDSDVDLIMEFSKPISLITLCGIKGELEERLGLKVDLIHGPLGKDAMIEINEVVELYAA